MWQNVQRLSTVICLSGVLAMCCLPIANPDLFWHLSAARWMLEQGAFPRADWLSHTMAETPWSNFEWLIQIVWYAFYRVAGMGGVWFLKAVSFASAAGLMWRLLLLYGTSASAAAVGVFLWSLASASANDVRPENVSLLLFLSLFGLLEARRLGRLRPVSPRFQMALLAGSFALWANCHAGFVYGIFLLGIFGILDAILRRRMELLAGAAVAAVAPLLNPYGWSVYRVVWEHWDSLADLGAYIIEWQEASILAVWQWPFWVLFFLGFLVVLARFLSYRDVPYEHLALLVVFGVSASRHVRTAVYFVSVIVPILWATALMWKSGVRPRRVRRAGAVLACIAAWSFFIWKFSPALGHPRFFDPAFVPREAANFLARNRDPLGALKLFNPWHWGGYLAFRLYPDFPVLVDGRYIFHSWLRPMSDARESPQKYQAFMDDNGVDLAVVRRTHQFVADFVTLKGGETVRLDRPFYLDFLPRKAWGLIHWDAKSLVFVRRAAVPAAWLEEKEYLHYRPDFFGAAVIKIKEGMIRHEDLKREVDRYFRDFPGSHSENAARAWLRTIKEES